MTNTKVDVDALPRVLEIVRDHTGIDFSVYRTATIRRRVLNHMTAVGIPQTLDYLHFLEHGTDASAGLVERLTIKVSSFYRNPPAFDALRYVVLPQLSLQREHAPLRIWSAGCGRGEEAYTSAMLLEEASVPGEVIATDIDTSALRDAESATFDIRATETLPGTLARRFLTPVGTDRVRVVNAVRHRVHFFRHDLTVDAPPGPDSFDLLYCRNVLIYLQRDTHLRILRMLCSRVAEGGYLALGEAEWPPPSLMATLQPLHRRTRLFRALTAAT